MLSDFLLMIPKYKYLVRFLSAVTITSLALSVSFAEPIAHGEKSDDPPYPVSASGKTILQSILADVLDGYAERSGSTIIVELPAATVRNTGVKTNPLNSIPETLTELKSLVSPLDYDIEEKSGIITLRKRYDVPGDVPDVSPEECLKFLDDALKLLSPFMVEEPPIVKPGLFPLVTNVYNLLSPTEKANASVAPSVVRDLPASQRDALRQSSLFIYTADSAAIWKKSRSAVAKIANISFSEKQSSSRRVARPEFGYTLTEDNQKKSFTSISLQEKTGKKLHIEEKNKITTLDALFSRVASVQNLSINASDGIGRKRILVFGSVEKAPMETLTATAEMFGLQLSPVGEKGFFLHYHEPEKVFMITELPTAIQKICPPSLLRAVGKKAVPSVVSPVVSMDARTLQKQQKESYQSALEVSNLRLSRLQSTIATEMKSAFDDYNTDTAPAKSLSFKRLSSENQDAFAVYLLLPALRVVRDRFTGNPPDYVRNFDDLYFSGREYDMNGQKWFKIMLFKKGNAGSAVNTLTIDGRVE